jgi:cobalt-zinc-cadmium efflux system outer membrane protein
MHSNLTKHHRLANQAKFTYPKLSLLLLPACLLVLISGCSFQQYSAKPIVQTANVEKIQQKDPRDIKFLQYLISNGYNENKLPLQLWNANDLTYCALYFHPSLDVARAQWRLAEQAEALTGAKPLPNLNGHLAKNNQANGDSSPYAFGLSIDIPIETASKRDIRIENAKHLSLAAKLDVAQVAWQLRYQVAQALNDFQFNQQQISLLTDEMTRRAEIVAIYQKRVNLGAATNVELSTAKLQLLTVSAELNAKTTNMLVLRSKLATNLGLPLAKVQEMNFVLDADKAKLDVVQMQADLPTTENFQTNALLNRLDIRIALEQYASAEGKLKLEVAKQYPDIVFSPGYAYEFGDKIWSLGLSGLLSLINKNKLAIAEATQLREVEAARFFALQSKVIAEADKANAELLLAKQTLSNQQKLRDQQQSNTQRMERKFKAGEIDRLELTFNQLEKIVVDKNVTLANFKLKMAQDQLENTLQIPLANIKNSSQSNSKINTNFEDLSFKKSVN